MKHRNLLPYFLIVISIPVSAWQSLKPIQINSENFPNINIYLEDFTESESISIVEEKNGFFKESDSPKIFREKGTRSVRFVLFVQYPLQKKRNEAARQIASSLIGGLNEDDRIDLVFFQGETFSIEENMNRSAAIRKLQRMNPAEIKMTGETLFHILNRVEKTELPAYYLAVATEGDFLNDSSVVEVSKKAREKRIFLNVLGLNRIANVKVCEFTEGKFFSLGNFGSFSALNRDIQNFRRNPLLVSYVSPFAETASLFDNPTVKVTIKTSSGRGAALKYDVNLPRSSIRKILRPEVFFPVSIFLLAVNISILLFLRKRKELLPIPSGPEIVENAITDESFIYKKMYGQGIPARRIEQRTQQVEDPGEFVEERESENFADEMVSSGESYDRAVLIQKDGPNPGRQYTISDSVTTIGRSEANDLVLWDSTLSGVHAKIKRLRNKYILFDMVSKKGITLNGKKLLRPRLLYDFDEIRLGRTTLIFRGK